MTEKFFKILEESYNLKTVEANQFDVWGAAKRLHEYLSTASPAHLEKFTSSGLTVVQLSNAYAKICDDLRCFPDFKVRDVEDRERHEWITECISELNEMEDQDNA